MNMFDVVQTIFNFFSMLYIHRFMIAFFDSAEKRNIKYLWLLYFVYPLFTSIVYFEANYPIINLAANIIALFVISLQYRIGLGQRIIAVGLTFFCMVSIESACVAATNYLGASAFQTGTYKNIVGLVVCNLIIFAVSLIIHNFKNMKKNILMPKSYWLAIVGIPSISIISILIILHSGKINQLQAIIVICAFLMINGFIFYLYDALVSSYNLKIQSTLLAEEKEYYYNQCQYMQQSEHEMNSFRHDVRNQLDMIYELLKHESKNSIKECVEKLEKDLVSSSVYSKTGNIALDSILNLKLSQAKQKEIQISCESEVPGDLQLNASDLMVILGNLLDNSITAAEKVKDNPFIKVEVSYSKGMLFISIENAYCGKIIEINGHLLTTKNNKEHHGYGLNNVKKVLESYHGMVEFEHKKNIFRVDAALYCKPSEV